MDWRIELNKLLAAFDRETSISLRNIKMAFKHSGFAFNAEFKQYFLRVSTDRIKNTYNEFEFNSMFEDDDSCDPDENISMADKYETMDSVHVRSHDVNDEPDEIVELSDEEDQPGYRMKLELLEELAAIQNDYHVKPSELNDADHFDYDRNYTAELSSNSYQKSATENEYDEHIASGSGVSMEANEMEVDGIYNEHRDIDKINDRTTTVNLNNEQNYVYGVITNNMKATSNRRPTKMVNPRSTSHSLVWEKSISSNQFELRKRFQCEFCQYSSNKKSHLKRHLYIHTGERPYRCNICDKGFTQSVDMKKHKVTHTNEIPFHCRGCFTGFLQKAEREAHEKVCKNRRYECHICKTMVTAQKTNLILHVRIHSGEKPFRCEICLKRFNTKGNLKAHLDTIHR